MQIIGLLLLAASFVATIGALPRSPVRPSDSLDLTSARTSLHKHKDFVLMNVSPRKRRDTSQESKPIKKNKKKPGKKPLDSTDKQLGKEEDFLRDCLATHNRYRKDHGVHNLVPDEKIRAAAQKWADHLAKTGEFEHEGAGEYGENLYRHSLKSTSCKEMVKGWYDEIDEYNFNKPGFTYGTGHFTAMVWRETTHLGCARAFGDSGVTLVCKYSPPGNWIGKFKENVPPPVVCDKSKGRCSATPPDATTTWSSTTTTLTPTRAPVTSPPVSSVTPAAAPSTTTQTSISTTSDKPKPKPSKPASTTKPKGKKKKKKPSKKKPNKSKGKKKPKKKKNTKKTTTKRPSTTTTTTTTISTATSP